MSKKSGGKVEGEKEQKYKEGGQSSCVSQSFSYYLVEGSYLLEAVGYPLLWLKKDAENNKINRKGKGEEKSIGLGHLILLPRDIVPVSQS